MARYGGGQEDFEREARALDAMRREREREIAKEVLYQKELIATTGLEDDAARHQATRRAAQREARTATQRSAEVVGREAKATDLDTAAIERNTRARQRQAEAARRQAVDIGRAVRGANDPLFAQVGERAAGGRAMGIRDMRRELGVGYGRARALADAQLAGFTPGNVGASQPHTRLAAAEVRVAAAELEYEQARRAQTNAIRRQGTTPEELAQITASRERAAASREAAKTELESVRREAAARNTNAAAIQREATNRQRAAGGPGQALVLSDPVGYERRMARDARREAATQRAVRGPGVVAEGGAVGGLLGGAATTRQARALADQAQAQGDLTTAAERYRAAMSSDDLARYNQVAAEYEERTRASAGATRQMSAATREAGVHFGTVSQQMTRHGALTSEFITAAARGETTMRELGNQAVVTAGKFGGWTIAASALFGAASALGRIGKGAMDAQGGVAQLSRLMPVDAGEAQQGFADLAREFNVPIEVAADAVYRMGQRFDNLPDAMEAARASLYSFKTGEVDVATSTQNLLAIVNGFGLEAQDLTAVYDQINEAQNRFGITIGDTEAGLAKAAGTFRNSGGDLSYLLGLFIAISRATGRSGQEIGTGLSRAAVQLRQPGNQARLEAQGVDVDPRNIQATIQSAMEAAQRPGADITAISTGLLGNQYFRLLEPVLRDQTALNEALRDTSPEASKDSAQKELAKTLRAAREQIAQLGIDLERLGSELAESGFFNVAMVLVEGLDQALNLAVGLVATFNELPSGLREGLVIFGQMYALMRVMRRMGTFEGLAGTPLSRLSNPDHRLQTYATRGLRDFRQEAFNEQERAARRAFSAQVNADVARQSVDAQRVEMDSRVRAGVMVPNSPDYEAAMKQNIAMDQRAAALQSRANEAMDDLNGAKAVAVRAETELAEVSKLHRNQVRGYLERNNIPIPVELGTPTTAGIRHLGGGPDSAPGFIGPITRAEAQAREAASRGMTPQMAARVDRMNAAVARAGANLGLTGAALARFTATATPPLERGAERVASAASGMRGLPGQMRSTLSSMLDGFGVLDSLFVAFAAYQLLLAPKLEEMQQRVKENETVLGRTPTSATGFEARRARLESIANQEDASGIEGALSKAVGTGLARLHGKETPQETIERERQIAQQELAVMENIRRRNAVARANGRPQSNLFADQVSAEIEQLGEDTSRGILSIGQIRETAERIGVEIQASAFITARQAAQLRSQLEVAQIEATSRPRDFRRRFSGLDADQLRERISASTAQLGRAGQPVGDFALDELSAAYRFLTIQQRGATTPEELQQVITDRETYFGAIEDLASREQEEGLLFARTEAARRGVFSGSRSTLGRVTQAARRAVTNSSRDVARLRERFRDRRDQAEALGEMARLDHNTALGPLSSLRDTFDMPLPGFGAGGAQAEADAAIKELREARNALDRDEKALREAMRRKRLALTRLAQEAFSDRQEGRSISLALAQSRTEDPVRDAELAVRSAERDVADARRFGDQSRQFRIAMTTLNEARISQADAVKQAAEEAEQEAEERRNNQLEIQRLLGDIAVARAGDDPVDAARAQIRVAQQARASATTRVERLQALLDLINANNGLEDALRDREDARFDLMASRTENPVRDARIEVRRARAALRGTTGAERTRGQARLNEALRAYEDSRTTEATETINFQLEMGRITRDQAIRQLEALKRGADLTRDQRRDLARQIKQLKDAGDQEASGFDLDVGSLKLPTIYDVRRAYAPLRRAIRDQREAAKGARIGADIRTNVANMHDQRSQVNAEVNVYVNDKNAAGEVYTALDRVLRTDTRSAMRSAGVR